MNRAAVIFLGSLLATAALQATATTYVRVEPDGTKTYSDRPIPGGKPVDVEPAQSYSNQQPTITAPSSNRPREQQLLEQMDDFRYSTCSISPVNDTTYVNPDTVTISVQLTPELQPVHRLSVTVDGQPLPGGPNSRGATLTEVFRGTHTVQLLITNQFGKPLCNATSSFHVQRPTLNSPARR